MIFSLNRRQGYRWSDVR